MKSPQRKQVTGAQLAKMRRPPTHPGEVFEEEFRKPSGISQAEAARRMGMSSNRLNEIVVGKRRLTPVSAVLFAALTLTSPQFWYYMQTDRDLWHALKAKRQRARTVREVATR